MASDLGQLATTVAAAAKEAKDAKEAAAKEQLAAEPVTRS
jgi:hypothetical protein